MLDFFTIAVKNVRGKQILYPKFLIKPSKDLMIRGRDFYAVWDEENGLWSTDEDTVVRIVDRELKNAAKQYFEKYGIEPDILFMEDGDSKSVNKFHEYCRQQMRDRWKPLDNGIIFKNTEVTRDDYASHRLSYSMEPGETPNYDRFMSVIFDETNRQKCEWMIGCIIAGDSVWLQKFCVLYGAGGTGKSTLIHLIEDLFDGYYVFFVAKELGQASADFALEPFAPNPLIAIQHDGDLSRIEDNTRLNSLVAHEAMVVNEKFKSKYTMRFRAFLILGTNSPVKITDAKSGIIRRLIDIQPTGNKLDSREYNKVTRGMRKELGAIAQHCYDVYSQLGPHYYDGYIPTSMMAATNDFYDFVEFYSDYFSENDPITLNDAYSKYQKFAEFAGIRYVENRRSVRNELVNYYDEYIPEGRVNGKHARSIFKGFNLDKYMSGLNAPEPIEEPIVENETWLKLEDANDISEFDKEAADWPAQYAVYNEEKGNYQPKTRWDRVRTTLSDLDPTELHYVKFNDISHIVIDFDIKGDNNEKSLDKNLEAASKWTPTYSEVSKSGNGVHLHYIYAGDPTELSALFAPNVEVKVFTGRSALRRQLTRYCNLPIATLPAGSLPRKEASKTVTRKTIENADALRQEILYNLTKRNGKESTTSCINYIYQDLERAYESGMVYDVSNLKQDVISFALGSTNQKTYCTRTVGKMKWKSDSDDIGLPDPVNSRPVIFDIEVVPNKFCICWAYVDDEEKVYVMDCPTSEQVLEFVTTKQLWGYNCRRYDNHIMAARIHGADIPGVYRVSKRLIQNDPDSYFGDAWNYSQGDLYDIASKKQSLKKWEIELGKHHQESGHDWDKEVTESEWAEMIEYCKNDVRATVAVYWALQADIDARKILSEISGLPMNATTRQHTTEIIFRGDKHPQLNIPTVEDFQKLWPKYRWENGHNMYGNIDLGMGGYVYAEQGIFMNVALIDVASLHPTSIRRMNMFGDYTRNYEDIIDARLAIKHHDYARASQMLDGKLSPYLTTDEEADKLAYALKIVINSVYGYTAASFDNPFKDSRNFNNVVALRGAIFMASLQEEVQARGFTVAHIKTDSIKIPNATPEIIKFCMDYANAYGYIFEHEATYSKMCLVNDAVYIAKYATSELCEKLYGYIPKDNAKHSGGWTATGKQFQVPFVFKSLFSHEPITIDDMSETREVKTALYLDMNEGLPDVEALETERDKLAKKDPVMNSARISELDALIPEGHRYIFVGKVGLFTPVMPGVGGGILVAQRNGKFVAVNGSKGYRFLETEVLKDQHLEEYVDISYYRAMVDDAKNAIGKYGDVELFISGDDNPLPDFMNIPNTDEEELPWE